MISPNTAECQPKHLALIMMLGVVVSNGKKTLPVWFEPDYRLTSAVYKEAFETKVLPWVKKSLRKQITSLNSMDYWHKRPRLCKNGVTGMSFTCSLVLEGRNIIKVHKIFYLILRLSYMMKYRVEEHSLVCLLCLNTVPF